MTTILAACRSCGRKARVPGHAIGRLAICPACHARYRIEADAPAVGDHSPEDRPAEIPNPDGPERESAFPDPAPPRPAVIRSSRPTPAPEPRPGPAEIPAQPTPREAPVPETYTGPYDLDEPFGVGVEEATKAARSPVAWSPPRRSVPALAASRPAREKSSRSVLAPKSALRKGITTIAAIIVSCLAVWVALRNYGTFGYVDPVARQAREDQADPIMGRETRQVGGKITTTIRRRSGREEVKVEDAP